MRIDTQFIDALFMVSKSPYLFNRGLYLPMQIILENLYIQQYLELKILRDFLVNQKPSQYLIDTYKLEPDSISELIRDTIKSIMISFENLWRALPSDIGGIVTTYDAMAACAYAGVPCVYLSDDILLNQLDITPKERRLLNAGGIYSIGQLYEAVRDKNWNNDFIGIGKTMKDNIEQKVYFYCQEMTGKRGLRWSGIP